MDLGLKGKLALVTGSTAGIGCAIAQGLLAEGARVVINGRTPARVAAAIERLKASGDVFGVAADMATAEGAATVVDAQRMIDAAKAKPRTLTYGSSGSGAPSSHLGMELLKVTAGVDIIHVPYKSMAPALVDVLGGQIQMAMPTINVILQHTRAGRLRAIGVTSLQRSPAAPDVPPLADQGMPGYEANNWYALFAPAGLPTPIADKIYGDVTKLLQSPELRDRFAAAGMEARSMPPVEFAAFVKREIAKWGKVVKASGAKAE